MAESLRPSQMAETTWNQLDTPWSSRVRTIIEHFGIHDFLLIFYWFGIAVALLKTPYSDKRNQSILEIGVQTLLLIGVMVHVRKSEKISAAFSLFYRTALFASLIYGYVVLKKVFVSIKLENLDAQMFDFDIRIFHFEPSMLLQKWIHPLATEWFSFAYLSYFGWIAFYAVYMLYFSKDKDTSSRFLMGMTLLFTFAQTCYRIIPGVGPHIFLSQQFTNQLVGSFFYPVMMSFANHAGARQDIFPSLHTAVPLFLTIFTFRNRKHIPLFRTLCWPMLFFTTQIIFSTMYLRWHYLLDVTAGIFLSLTAIFFCEHFYLWDSKRRVKKNLRPFWI